MASSPLPDGVRRAAERQFLNVLATAIAASDYPEVRNLVGMTGSVDRQSPIPGRRERVDPYHAAFVTAFAANLTDFDDTYLDTVLHPGSTALGAVLSLGAALGSRGDDCLRAFAVCVEAQIRLSLALSLGGGVLWQNTGTCGVIGCAVACGVLLDFAAPALADSVGLAATQSLGHRGAIGTQTKTLHYGKTAANGVLTALLVRNGLSAAPDLLEGEFGYVAMITGSAEAERILDDADSGWHLEDVAIKPYPCGIVCHPVIDACLSIASEVPDPSEVENILVRCHPLVEDLAGNRTPTDGFETQVSAAHGAAVALADRTVTLANFSDQQAHRLDLAQLRRAIVFERDNSFSTDEAEVIVTLRGGRSIASHVPHARGSKMRPLTELEVTEKADRLIEPVLPGASKAIIAAIGNLSDESSLSHLLSTLTPP